MTNQDTGTAGFPAPAPAAASLPASTGLTVGRPGSTAADSGWRPGDSIGLLCVALRPREKTGTSQYGEFTAAECDAVVRFNHNGSEALVFEDTTIFQKWIADGLINSQHPVVPFIVGQSEARGRNNPAWIIDHKMLSDDHLSFVAGWAETHLRLLNSGRIAVRSDVPRHDTAAQTAEEPF